MDLMKEISDLESQVVYLEKHLLSLYRETFDQNVPTLELKSSHRRSSSEVCWNDHCHIPSNLKEEHENDPIFVLPDDQSSVHSKKVMNSGINRCHSTLTGVDPYHSFPLSMLENSDDDDGTSSSLSARSGYLNQVSETPNWISEEMIKLISAIYCELASDPHFFARDSPQASFFSETDSSPHEDNYDHTECISQMSLSRSSSSLNSVVVMQFNYRDNPRLKTVKHMLWSFKLLVSRLERVDAKIMRYEEKLAFWINVHNALIMHAYIVYGIPYGNLRRKTSLVLKAAYIVGGHAISIEMIQNLILGCRLNKRQGQTYWLPSLFNLRTKSKGGSEHHVLRHYAVQQEEHRLYFALCSGSHSDPMVRVFTPDKVFEELEAAKEDYIRTNIVIVEKKQKIILPKIVYSFARDAQMSARALVDMIKPFLSDEGKRMKKIEWMSHNYDFRYLIAKELVK
ncbi:uncharacterized protein LOC124927321 [Impatiens glandulifera]|uniref:uncharacterized protein LOC124927321 n=1 Tax=Impatiens glandulifera TaxID=253017 RepID=UPI001FB164A8|nr:uncharacterized protein LOC124927321 [Impatiens glandulifera]